MASQGLVKTKYPLKIINAGMFRSGTSSLSLALKELGFTTFHMITNSDDLTRRGSKWWVENKIVDKLLNSHDDIDIDFDEWLQEIDCQVIMDTPVALCWQNIYRQYPDCKVILCVRDFQSWSKSYSNILNINSEPAISICTMTDAFTRECLKLWDGYHVGTDHVGMRQLVYLEKSKRDKILKKEYYDKPIETAKQLVPKEKLLIFDVKNGWEPLCKFLNKPIPDKPFPKINSTKEFNEWSYEYKKKCFYTFLKHRCGNLYVIVAIVVLVFACFARQ